MSKELMQTAFRAIEILHHLREVGWMVAVHNDYIFQGKRYTFWLLTLPSHSLFVRGEGESDYTALFQCEEAIKKLSMQGYLTGLKASIPDGQASPL